MAEAFKIAPINLLNTILQARAGDVKFVLANHQAGSESATYIAPVKINSGQIFLGILDKSLLADRVRMGAELTFECSINGQCFVGDLKLLINAPLDASVFNVEGSQTVLSVPAEILHVEQVAKQISPVCSLT